MSTRSTVDTSSFREKRRAKRSKRKREFRPLKEHLQFLATFIKHPLSVGAVAPSSKFLALRMLEGIDLSRARAVVELGPGTGAFTRVILEHMPQEALYLALELNEGFARELKRRFPAITVINDSAENLERHLKARGIPHADEIFCGLPWASFPPALQERILAAVVRSLRPGGHFATFAYVHAAWFPTARRFHRLLKSHFASVATTPVVWRNVPPAFIYRCRKDEGRNGGGGDGGSR